MGESQNARMVEVLPTHRHPGTLPVLADSLSRTMEPVERFDELVRSRGSQLPLDDAVLLIAEALDPTLEVVEGVKTLDALAEQAGRAGVESAVGLMRFLGDDIGFAGDSTDYYNPLNSLLPRVIERRLGIPISLAIVAIEVGRRCGLRLVGVGMPGHFLVGEADRRDRFYDLFNGGGQLDGADCGRIFQSLGGNPHDFHPGLLEPVNNLVITVRVLNNLKAIYMNASDVDRLRIVTDLRGAFDAVGSGDRAALAVALASRGRFGEAAQEFEQLARGATGDDRDGYERRAEQLWARLN